MSRETLLAELDRLLDLGEPLLTMYPKQFSNSWVPKLPDNISDEMRWYANYVTWRAWNRKGCQDYWQGETTVDLAEWVKDFEVGLLGWRAIGVLK